MGFTEKDRNMVKRFNAIARKVMKPKRLQIEEENDFCTIPEHFCGKRGKEGLCLTKDRCPYKLSAKYLDSYWRSENKCSHRIEFPNGLVFETISLKASEIVNGFFVRAGICTQCGKEVRLFAKKKKED